MHKNSLIKKKHYDNDENIASLFDGEVRVADTLSTGAWVFCPDQFEVEDESPVRRQRSAHREQISRDADPVGKRDEVGGVGQRCVQTLGVALWTQERLSLTFHVSVRKQNIIRTTALR